MGEPGVTVSLFVASDIAEAAEHELDRIG